MNSKTIRANKSIWECTPMLSVRLASFRKSLRLLILIRSSMVKHRRRLFELAAGPHKPRHFLGPLDEPHGSQPTDGLGRAVGQVLVSPFGEHQHFVLDHFRPAARRAMDNELAEGRLH